MRLANKVALVTGGGSGIGQAIAERCAREGARVIVAGRTLASVEETVDHITQAGGEAVPVEGDVSNPAAVEAMMRQALDTVGHIDILVNNAGTNRIAPFAEIDSADFDRILEVNVRAAFLLSRSVIGHMRSRKWGRIVSITSIFGLVGREQRASYSASKFALDGITVALAAEVAADGILANCVAPGVIETDLTRQVLGEDGIAEVLTRVPMRRLGRPEEVAALVVWLAGPENTFISAQNIAIDGGYTRV